MKFVNESLEEFINEARMEMFYLVSADPEIGEYTIVNKDNETVWQGLKDDLVTFLLRNAGIGNTFEAKNLIAKADKFGGKSMTSGDTIEKKGPFGRYQEKGEGAKVLGAPIMMQPFMVNKEIVKGKYEAPRKTHAQVAKKQSREREEIDMEGQNQRKKDFSIPDEVYKRRAMEDRKLIKKRRQI